MSWYEPNWDGWEEAERRLEELDEQARNDAHAREWDPEDMFPDDMFDNPPNASPPPVP